MSDANAPVKQQLLGDKLYNYLKWVSLIGLPALGSLYFALSGIWGLPAAQEVVGTVVAVDTFLGVVLGISTKSYNASDSKYDGSLNVFETPEKTVFQLDVSSDPDVLSKKENVNFKVNNTPSE